MIYYWGKLSFDVVAEAAVVEVSTFSVGADDVLAWFVVGAAVTGTVSFVEGCVTGWVTGWVVVGAAVTGWVVVGAWVVVSTVVAGTVVSWTCFLV